MTMKEESIPAFVPSLSVFKDGAILSNIFLIDPEWEEEEEEMVLVLGRHPACDIVADHPSISRWHLQIQIQKSSQQLLLTDLSSVHGTFVCGQRATPELPIALRVNDTFTVGTSTRVYKFHWLPYPSEEVDCPTPPLSRIISTHELMHGVNGGNEERVLMEEQHVNAVESTSRKLIPSLSGVVSEHDKEECRRNNEKRERASKQKEYVKVDESINPSNLNVYGPNKQEHAYGDLGAGRSNYWNMECGCVYYDASKEKSVEEERCANAVEFISRNLAPTLSDIVSENDKQEDGHINENRELAPKRKKYFKTDESIVLSNQVPFLFDAVLELNKQESEFDEENMEKTSMTEDDVKVIHPSFSCEYAYYYFFMNHEVDTYSSREKTMGDVKVIESDPKNLNRKMLDGIWEPNKQTFDENKKQFSPEEEHVELVESVPCKPEQPPEPPLLESQSHLDCFTVVTDAEMTLVQQNQSLPREKNVGIGASNLWWSRKQNDGNGLQTGCMEMNLNPEKIKENHVDTTKQRRILKENSSTENILEEKNVRCEKKNGVLGEKNRDCILQVLPTEICAHGLFSTGSNTKDNDFYPSDKENWTSQTSSKTLKISTRNIGRVDQHTRFLQTDTGRVPSQSLSQNSRVNNRQDIRSSLKNTNKSMDIHQGLQSEVQIPVIVQLPNLVDKKKKWHIVVDTGCLIHDESLQALKQLEGIKGTHLIIPNLVDSKKKWHMVVDTGCLIHDESLQALKQLEGIKGTHLIIPRIVIQELDCLKCQNKSKKEEAQEILRWIEQCMINKGWWVHVQSSAECFSVGDVMSPIAEDHILEFALMYERLPNGVHVVLLTNDVALKVKAMAEGMLCENAREFCQSLLSPYSERFLWPESTAHGRNWTNINNSNIRKPFGLTRKWACFGMTRNSLLHHEEPKNKSNEYAKGLKLISLHDSHFDHSASSGI